MTGPATKPEDAIGALATCPIALLPVRLETRFPPGTQELRIRIYPDQVHLDGHRPGLTDTEVDTGRAYWRSRWAGQADAAWLDLTRGLRPARARWVVHATTPSNVERLGEPAGPVFAEPERADATLGAVARLAALPAQWLLVGYQNGAEVLRVRTAPVALDLVVGLLDSDGASRADGDRPLGKQAAWAADYDLAVAAGMAVTVPAASFGGAGFGAGLDRLIALGVAVGATPADGAAALEHLLAAHSYSDGLSLLASGVPTNDTATATPASTRPQVADPASAPANAAVRLRTDLGLTEGSAIDALPLTTPSGSPVDQAAAEKAAGAMVDALWSSTLGYALQQMYAPSVRVPDARAARAHAHDHLRPAGRYPAIQVGRQPYGVLPVVASAHLAPAAVPGRVTGLLRMLKPVWTAAADSLPRLAPGTAAGADVDSTLFELLRRAPASTRFRFRTILGPMLAANTAGLTGAHALQAQVRGLLFTGVLGATQPPRLTDFVAHPRHQPLRVPTVGPGTGQLQPNYLETIASTLLNADARTTLTQTRPRSLLEALVGLAAVHEIDSAVAQLASRHAPAGSPLRRTAWITPELPGVTAASAPSPRLLGQLTLPGLARPLLAKVTELLLQARADPSDTGADRDVVAGLLALLDAVEELGSLDPPTLEAALIGFLDACSHRLDAWFTSLASSQLAVVRAAQPTGVHVGACGWVEGVHPEQRPDPAGYLLAPSLAHASAAAVLRSGFQTHQDEGDGAFDIDLTSSRAEQALELLREVGSGTGLGQVLGYHFERGLHDRGLQRLVQTMRSIAPLHPGPPRFATHAATPPPDPDTVDGETLLGRRDAVHRALAGQPAGVLTQVDAELDLLAQRLDAVGDLATAESVHQLVLGRPERVRAALALLDRQDPAPEPEITRTPRSGTGFVHRVLVVLTATAPADGWSGIPRDARSTAEPRLDAWLGRLLGRPDRWVFSGHAIDAGGQVIGAATTNLAKLRLSPLALVLATGTATTGRPSQLEDRVAQLLAAAIGPQPTGSTLQLLPQTPGALGLAAFLAHAGAIRTMLEKVRPADAAAFAPPDAVVADGVDVAELAARADAAAQAFARARTRLIAALAAPVPVTGAVRDALDAAGAAGASGAHPALELLGAATDQDPAGAGLLVLARSVATAMAAVTAQLRAVPSTANIDDQRGRLELLLGSSAPTLPTFHLSAPASMAVRAAVDGQTALTANDPLATATWFTRMSRVRPSVGALWRMLVGAETATGGFAADQVVVTQQPHVDGARWAGLEFGPDGAPQAEMALVVVAPGGAEAMAAALAPGGSGAGGLVVDGWSELVPVADQSAGLAFQYDAPGNRAPQAWLLAVPPDAAAATWTAEQLLDTVVEAADLVGMRAVTLADIPTASPVLPAIYLPATLGPEVAGIDLHQWVPTTTMVLGRD